ncbi:titin-like [Salvia splendens]|uniref:titin-like n=1 Tax=Salvia splendens TaxID=180675 RepID=UPI001C26367B|nr:titin-like [Salvia splendens]
MEDDTAVVAEGLDLASRAVGESEETGIERVPEGPAYQPGDRADDSQAREEEIMPESPQPEAEMGDTSIEEQETEAKEAEPEIDVPVPVAPPVVKPKAVKKKLVLKGEPKASRPKPQRVSQRCLGRWAASKAKANTAENPEEIVSEEQKDTPKRTGDEPIHATGLEDTAVSPAQSEQGKETERVVEGLDLAPESVGPDGSKKIDARVHGETTSTAQDESLLQAEEEARYQQARKRKGKAPIQRKSITKKSRVVNTGIVITEAARRTPPSRQELSDSEYAVSEESASDSDISLEDEEPRNNYFWTIIANLYIPQ